jgi:hypothetical protein
MQYSIRNFSEALFLRFMVRSREDTDWGGGIVRTCIEIKCGVQVMPLACGPSTEVDELKLSSGHLESPRSAQVLYGKLHWLPHPVLEGMHLMLELTGARSNATRLYPFQP